MELSEAIALIWENRGMFFDGVFMTLHLTLFSLILGLIIAIPSSLIVSYRVPYLNKLVEAYIYVFRGSPLIVQLFLIYYGLAQFEWVRDSFLWVFFREAYWCALLTFALNTGAYTTVLLQGAIEATPKGEIEAAKAYGMNRLTQIKRIILPNSFRRALPAYSNEVIFTLHGSSLASTVQLMDILGAGRWLSSRYYLSLEGFMMAGLLYAGLTFLIIMAIKPLEVKWNRHLTGRI